MRAPARIATVRMTLRTPRRYAASLSRKDQSPPLIVPSNNNTVVILNPAANSDRALRARSRVEELAHECTVCTTTAPGEAEILARHAVQEGFTKIVAAGGGREPSMKW